MKIGLTYDLKTDYSLKKGESEDTLAEFDPPQTIKDLEEALISLGHKVIKIGRAENLLKKLNGLSLDLVFNLAEGNYGRNRESWVPTILELKKIPFIGSDSSILAICLDKLLTKKLLISKGIPTPDFRGAENLGDLKNLTLNFPLMVKPRYGGSAKGISVKSIVKNKKELIPQVKFILTKYKQPALVEEFIRGSEFTVAIIGNRRPEIMPVIPRAVDIDTTLSTHVLEKEALSFKIKEAAEIIPELEENLKYLALKTYKALDCFDFARVDFRVDEQNNPFVLEINPLPNLSKDDSFGLLAQYLNIDYKDIINKMLKAGIKRLGINEKSLPACRTGRPAGRQDKNIYSYPEYHHLSYRWNKDKEVLFLEECFKKFSPLRVKNILDVGCGSGLHLKELSKKGYHPVGFDINTEMAKFVRKNLDKKIKVLVSDMHKLAVNKKFDAAICMMDTFRFLLTNEDIISHFKQLGPCLKKGGLYILEFWAPFNYKKIARENYNWEQTDGGLKVKTFYKQHFSTLDVISQTFEDELSYLVEKNGATSIIKKGRAKTRLIFPQEFKALVLASGVFKFVEWFSDFDLGLKLSAENKNWRIISVLRRK